jgi:hypothetical protein
VVATVTGRDPGTQRSSEASPRRGAIADGARPSAAAPGSIATRRPGSDLPEIRNNPLIGAPATVFVVRDGRDARLVEWRPGVASLREQRGGFPDAFSDADSAGDASIAWLSPDLASLVVSDVGTVTGEGADAARLVTRDGIAWRSDGVTTLGGLVWSGLGDRFAIAGRHDRWLLVERDPDARWATTAEVDVSPGRATGPGPSPTPGSVFALTDRIRPGAFSRSGEWIVGARLDPDVGGFRPAVRVRFGDASVDPIDAFPTAGPDGIGTGPSQLVDTTTGRTVVYGPNASIPGGPPQLEVHEADGEYAFGVRSAIVVGWLWTGDGRLLVLGADGAPFPTRWTLQLIDAEGGSQTLAEAPRASQGVLLGIRDGYVGLFLTGSAPERSQIVVVRLADAAASSISVPSIGDDGPIGSGWEP